MIEQLEDTKTNESTDFVIKAYDNNGQTVKLNIQYDGITMEIEYVYGDESSIKITAVEDETEDGLSYKITNKKSDLTQNVDFEMSVIEEGLVSQTVTFSTEVVKSGSDYTLNLGYEIKSQEQTISVDSVSDIEFTDVDIDDLTTDNCVYIDDLTEEEFKIEYERAKEEIKKYQNLIQKLDKNREWKLDEKHIKEIVQKFKAGNYMSNDFFKEIINRIEVYSEDRIEITFYL